MPLKPGSSQNTISNNISEFHGGKTYNATKKKFGKEKADKQAVAVAMSNARKYAVGGGVPWFERSAARNLLTMNKPKATMLHSEVPGRTDHLPLQVPSGSYVIPSDIVSALGQGNSQSGAKEMGKLLHSGALRAPKLSTGKLKKLPFKTTFRAHGGATPSVPVLAAGGEIVIHPDAVAEIGHGDMDSGHRFLDGWVVDQRKKLIKTLRGLKPPVKG